MRLLFLTTKIKSVSVPLNVIICDSFFGRLVGALGSGGILPGEAYLFPGCSWPHTWFMRRSISVLFYDNKGKIVDYLFNVPPFTVVKAVDAAGMIELDARRLPKSLIKNFNNIRFSQKIAGRLDCPGLAYRPDDD